MNLTPISPTHPDLIESYIQRDNILRSPNLLFWYGELYKRQMAAIEFHPGQAVLEVGSGASVLKRFFPTILTSDVLPLKHVDFQINAENLNEVVGLPKELQAIVMTNVLHHMRDPLRFFTSALNALGPNGKISVVEPYFSFFGTLLYCATRKIHGEGIDFSAATPTLRSFNGPLSSANMALPQLLLLKQRFASSLNTDFHLGTPQYFTFLAYFLTGGAKRRFRIPSSLYKIIFKVDRWLADGFPCIFATFFILVLQKKPEMERK